MSSGIDPWMLGGCELDRIVRRSGEARAAQLLRFSAGFRMRVQMHAEHCGDCREVLGQLLDESRFGEDSFQSLTLDDPERLDAFDDIPKG